MSAARRSQSVGPPDRLEPEPDPPEPDRDLLSFDESLTSATTILASYLPGPAPQPFQRRIYDRFLRSPLHDPDHRHREPDGQLVGDAGTARRVGFEQVSAGHVGDHGAPLDQVPAHLVVAVPGVAEHVLVLDDPAGIQAE